MNKAYEDHLSKQIVRKYRELEQRIMEDIVRRIRESSTITSTADWQIDRLMTLGNASADIRKMVEEAVKGNAAEVQRIYDEVIDAEYTRDQSVYEKMGKPFVPYDQNLELIALTEALVQHSNDELYNITRTMGFIMPKGPGQNEFQALSEVMATHLDRAMMDITSGAFDYNTVIKRIVAQMTASGLRTIEYASGHTNRVDVAARRAVMTGIGQLAGTIADMNAQKLGTEYFEIDWHMGARPTHQPWQGRVYSREELVTVCGLGTVTGLLGANCYHTYYPFIPGVSERAYTDEWLDAKNKEENTPREYKGRKYTLYEALQHQRHLETTMRAQREKATLLEQGGADEEDVVLAKCKYQATLNEYKNFSKEMNLRTQMERVYYDGKGHIAPTKKQYADFQAKKDEPADIAQRERVEEARREDLDNAVNGSKINTMNVTRIGTIDKNIYTCVTNDIRTTDVVITEKQIAHIKQRHPQDYERFSGYFSQIVANPDYIIETKMPNTAMILKTVSSGERFKTILRLVTTGDKVDYLNSIITFMKIDQKEWDRLLRNKKTLYKRE